MTVRCMESRDVEYEAKCKDILFQHAEIGNLKK